MNKEENEDKGLKEALQQEKKNHGRMSLKVAMVAIVGLSVGLGTWWTLEKNVENRSASARYDLVSSGVESGGGLKSPWRKAWSEVEGEGLKALKWEHNALLGFKTNDPGYAWPYPVQERACEGVSREERRGMVVEFFSYGCIHCAHFHETLSHYPELQGKIRYLPSVLRESWVPLAKAFWVFSDLQFPTQWHTDLFEAQAKGAQLEVLTQGEPQALEAWVRNRGGEEKAKNFRQRYDSVEVENKIKWTRELEKAIGIPGTPVFLGVDEKGQGALLNAKEYDLPREYEGRAPEFLVESIKQWTGTPTQCETPKKKSISPEKGIGTASNRS